MMKIIDAAPKQTICLGKPQDLDKAFHVALTATANYISQLGMVMMSAVHFNPSQKFVFHLFVNELPAAEESNLKEFVKLTGQLVYIHIMCDEPFKKDFHLNRPAVFFYRLLIPDLVKEFTDRILYLDGDMMIGGDLAPLWELDLGEKLAAVVKDRYSERPRAQLGVERYFNAGMMLINVKAWVKENLLEEILQTSHMLMENLNQKGRIAIWNNAEYHDQTMLNKILDKRVIWLPKKYNYVYKLNRPALFHKQEHNDDYRPQVVLHFAGDVKPWHSWVQDWDVVKVYQSIRSQSPWKNNPPVQPVTRKDYHRAAREYRATRMIGKAFRCYMEYYKRKIKHKK